MQLTWTLVPLTIFPRLRFWSMTTAVIQWFLKSRTISLCFYFSIRPHWLTSSFPLQQYPAHASHPLNHIIFRWHFAGEESWNWKTNDNGTTVMEAAVLQFKQVFSVGWGLDSARCLPFQCGITEEVISVHRTAPEGAPEEEKGYAVITDTLSRTPDKCSQSESVT